MFNLTHIVGGFIKLLGGTNKTPIGNVLDALKVNLRDGAGDAFGTSTNPISVNVTSITNDTPINNYGEAAAVASGATTTIVSYTVPVAKTASLERVSVSGENIALYTVLVNAIVIDTRRTWFGGALNTEFNFMSTSNAGRPLVAGDVVLVQVLHNRPTIANFQSRIQLTEVN